MASNGEIDVKIEAQKLGLSLEKLADELVEDFNQAIQDLAHGAHAKIIAEAQERLHGTRQDYLKGLTFSTIGENSYLISIDGELAQKLEQGYQPFDMIPGMLKSKKIVEVGSRAGQPWVQKNKKGDRFAHVPMEHKPFAKGNVSDLAQAIRKLEVDNRRGRKQKITSIFKDVEGNPLQGKVAVAKNTGIQNLENLVKYQKIHKKGEKETVQSVYMTYRTVSDNGKSWIHPGFDGLKAFEHAEQWVESELQNILKTFLE